MMMAPQPSSQMDLVALVDGSRLPMRDWHADQNVKLTVPMVHLRQTVDIGWMGGLATSDESWFVSQALQQVRFGLNRLGARAVEATAFAMERCIIPAAEPYFIIDRPFAVWIERRGCNVPVFLAYCAEGVWSDPGDLATI